LKTADDDDNKQNHWIRKEKHKNYNFLQPQS